MKLTKTKIKELALISAGHSFRGKIKDIPGSGIRVLQLRDVSLESEIRWSDCQETKLVKPNSGNWLKNDDILIVARGSHFFAKKISGIDNMKVVASPYFYIVRLINNEVTPSFLTWFINQTTAQDYFSSKANGTKSKNIRREVVEQLQIPIPNMSTQNSICALDQKFKNEKELLMKKIKKNQTLLSEIADNLVYETAKH